MDQRLGGHWRNDNGALPRGPRVTGDDQGLPCIGVIIGMTGYLSPAGLDTGASASMSLHVVAGEVQVGDQRLAGQFGELGLDRGQRLLAQLLLAGRGLQLPTVLAGDQD